MSEFLFLFKLEAKRSALLLKSILQGFKTQKIE